MHFTKETNIPGIAVFLDFEKAFDSIKWNFIHKCLETFNFGLDLRQWIKVFYTAISSYVFNNGYASKHFHLERGVRQGCPLSGTLFVIVIELLVQSIRRSKEIKGITIDEHNERCSGLKLNQTKSEMLWLGFMHHRKDTILDLQMSGELVYALGVHFTYDLEESEKKKFF